MKGSDIIARTTDDLVTTLVDGELMGMSVEKGICYGFDRIGTRLWEMIESPCSLDDLCARLTAQFAVSAEDCRADVTAFLGELERQGLVTIRPAA